MVIKMDDPEAYEPLQRIFKILQYFLCCNHINRIRKQCKEFPKSPLTTAVLYLCISHIQSRCQRLMPVIFHTFNPDTFPMLFPFSTQTFERVSDFPLSGN